MCCVCVCVCGVVKSSASSCVSFYVCLYLCFNVCLFACVFDSGTTLPVCPRRGGSGLCRLCTRSPTGSGGCRAPSAWWPRYGLSKVWSVYGPMDRGTAPHVHSASRHLLSNVCTARHTTICFACRCAPWLCCAAWVVYPPPLSPRCRLASSRPTGWRVGGRSAQDASRATRDRPAPSCCEPRRPSDSAPCSTAAQIWQPSLPPKTFLQFYGCDMANVCQIAVPIQNPPSNNSNHPRGNNGKGPYTKNFAPPRPPKILPYPRKPSKTTLVSTNPLTLAIRNDWGAVASRSDLPLASAKPATPKQVWALLRHARDATDSYRVLVVSEARATGRHTARGPYQARPSFPGGRQRHVWSRCQDS